MAAWKMWQSGNKIDDQLFAEIAREKNILRQIFHRLIDVVLYLAEQNLAFRGSYDKTLKCENGNFLATIDLLAKYDPVLNAHMLNKKSYLSPSVQNELIHFCSEKVLNSIKNDINKAKFFSILADTTTDITHTDQLSIVIRYLHYDIEKKTYSIRESFTGFIKVSDATATGLEETILEHIDKKLCLNLKFCRGQGYDGASVMSGIYNGLSAKILARQKLAFYVHCAAHCLNLVLSDAATVAPEIQTFFGVLQKVYTFLSGSNYRWDYFKQCCEQNGTIFTVKKICETRWESRIDAVYSFIKSYKSIIECLENIRDGKHRKCKNDELVDVQSILSHVTNFQFILLLFVWEKVLTSVKLVSKELQKTDSNISLAAELLKISSDDMLEFRQKGFDVCHTKAVSIAEEHNLSTDIPCSRKRYKKKFFDRNCRDEPQTDMLKIFEINVFNKTLDTVVSQLKHRLKGVQVISDTFNFLSPGNYVTMNEHELKEKCENFCKLYDEDISHDIIPEILSFRKIVEGKISSKANPFNILNFMSTHNLCDVYPNITAAYRLLLTIPTSIAECERNFSKLKLIKTYLRSSMSQERLSGLAMISIENKLSKTIEYDEIIDTFSSAKSRKGKF